MFNPLVSYEININGHAWEQDNNSISGISGMTIVYGYNGTGTQLAQLPRWTMPNSWQNNGIKLNIEVCTRLKLSY